MSRTVEGFRKNKKGKKTENSVSSLEVDSNDMFSNSFLTDLEKLAVLKGLISEK